jgi:hypothetical protein
MLRVVSASALSLIVVLGASAPASAAEGSTTITLKVTGCNGCVFQAQNSTDVANPYNGPKAKVSGGVATMTIPTVQTSGMVLSIDPSWDSKSNAEPLVVFQYQGAEPGTRVTKAKAKTYKKASPCWVGTADAAAQIRITVRRVWAPAFDPGAANPGRTQLPLAWVIPTTAAPTPFWPTYKGSLATQNSVQCATG